MQILENSVLGLRSARLVFADPDRDISLTIFPMVHVAEPAFYDEVFDEAYAADLILTEGIDTPIIRRLTRAYRYIATKDNGLVLQTKADPKFIPERTLRADLAPEEFVVLWNELPLWQRGLVTVASPLIGLRDRFWLDREKLAKNLEMDDLPDRQSKLLWSPFTQAFETALIHARDEHLVNVLTSTLGSATPGSKTALVYGAQHIPAVLAALPDIGFVWKESTWLTVFKN